MPGLLHEGVFIMGHKRPAQGHGQRGIWKHRPPNSNDPDVKVADVSYQNDKLAEIVALAWINTNHYADKLLDHTDDFAQKQLEAAGIKLSNPVVLTEDEYNDGWQMDSGDDVVFVLPDVSRVNKKATDTKDTLLETAKMLMACVPNGI
jgi:hypothetical protein